MGPRGGFGEFIKFGNLLKPISFFYLSLPIVSPSRSYL